MNRDLEKLQRVMDAAKDLYEVHDDEQFKRAMRVLGDALRDLPAATSGEPDTLEVPAFTEAQKAHIQKLWNDLPTERPEPKYTKDGPLWTLELPQNPYHGGGPCIGSSAFGCYCGEFNFGDVQHPKQDPSPQGDEEPEDSITHLNTEIALASLQVFVRDIREMLGVDKGADLRSIIKELLADRERLEWLIKLLRRLGRIHEAARIIWAKDFRSAIDTARRT
jgi:hypothetical protein